MARGRRKTERWAFINDKRVKPMYEISSWGNVRNFESGKYMKPYEDKDGYLKYTLQGYDKKIHFFAHVLVATYFIEKPNPDFQVNHKNFNKKNNYYKNLEWISQHDNILHARRRIHKQIVVCCQAHGRSTMTNDFVRSVCELFEKGYSVRETLNVLGYSKDKDEHEYELMRGRLKHIKSHSKWTSISRYYNF